MKKNYLINLEKLKEESKNQSLEDLENEAKRNGWILVKRKKIKK